MQKAWVLIFSLLMGLFTASAWAQTAPVLEIESDAVLSSVISEHQKPGSAPEVYLLADQYRLDLTFVDLVDQATLLLQERTELNQRLAREYARSSADGFFYWFEELKKIAAAEPSIQKILDRKLKLQFYNAASVALRPEYKFIDLDKIKDNALLVRIDRYNDTALDPEGVGIRAAFELTKNEPFFTKEFTVAKLKAISKKRIRTLQTAYYHKLMNLYHLYDTGSSYSYAPRKQKLTVSDSEATITETKHRVVTIINALPNKQEVLVYLSARVPQIPVHNGIILLTPRAYDQNCAAIEDALQDFTRAQIMGMQDDRYLLTFRKWTRDNNSKIRGAIDKYNKKHGTKFVLFHKNAKKLPRRAEAVLNHEVLVKVFPDAPWFTREFGLIIDKKGKERFLGEEAPGGLGRFFKNLAHELIQTETYVSILAGTSALILSHGNLVAGLGTQKLVKRAIETQRYDREWKEFLKEIPDEVLNAFMVGAGFSSGRFLKILALGAGQGVLQSFFTGQDIRTGAAVGMFTSFLAYYVVPSAISRPMADGFDEKALKLNRRLETLERSIRNGIQGATVAALDGESILGGAIKGTAYGFLSARFLIWFVGTRYNPFKDYASNDIDEMIELENKFQNEVGRGGSYNINRQLILDANYRVGGVLQDAINASITLPGNVAMGDGGFTRLTTMTHEASHLMQQHQSGVFGFYLFRYLPTSLKTGYSGHPDENFLQSIIDQIDG